MASTQQLLLGEGAGGAEKVYIEDVFSTYLYTGNASGGVGTIDVVNNIDLSTKGGLVWVKPRSGAGGTDPHALYDTARGARYGLSSNLTDAQTYASVAGRELYQFNADGFSVGPPQNYNVNQSTVPFVSWTFRKQPKFFDVVTYTGNGTSGRTVAHSLGSTPGCIIVKRTSGDPIEWAVYHRSLDATSPQNYYLRLNTTAARALQSGNWNDTAPTSTVFTLGDSGAVNTNGETYVAYIFAHDAGGFGLTGTDNVISCGSYTDGALTSVNLGWEPQWLLVKPSSSAGSWVLVDTMRNMSMTNTSYVLAESSAAEASFGSSYFQPTPTGFYIPQALYGTGTTMIYIAIRRGPMKVPTDGTKVFAPVTYTGTGGSLTTTTGINQDSLLIKARALTYSALFTDRLRGVGGYWMNTASTDPENGANSTAVTALGNTSFTQGGGSLVGSSGQTYVAYGLTRAPSFFDEVCYTGNSTAGRAITHNLGVAPELIIVKSRSAARAWRLWHSAFSTSYSMRLNNIAALDTATNILNSTSPTASVFTTSADPDINYNNYTYVAYLFASCPGVSKVGSYTGTGTTKQVDCGFAAGARFVLIKRTDSTGDWYVWDSARGIVSGNDPYLLLNSTAPEVTSTDYIDTYSAGFEISSTAPAAINASGGTFIFLAIA